MNMKYFMREELKNDEVVEVPGIDTFRDENGDNIPFKIKVLGIEEVNKIRKNYTSRRMAVDDKGKRLFDKAGRPIFTEDVDSEAATRRIIVEALEYPNLKDPELMKFFGVNDVMEMPFKLFKNSKDYSYISTVVVDVLGLGEQEVSDDELINEAKN